MSAGEPDDLREKYDEEITRMYLAEGNRLRSYLIRLGTPVELAADIEQDSFVAVRLSIAICSDATGTSNRAPRPGSEHRRRAATRPQTAARCPALRGAGPGAVPARRSGHRS